MLGETKKSGTNMRRSAKLPKLNIQQQIDNQQIADRMNKKITFTKNPRHLGQTLSYAEAFATTHQQPQGRFRVEPQQLFFSDYDTNHIYESEVRLVNVSRYIQRVKVTPLKQKQFVLAGIKYPNQHSGDIAPGMAVTVSIRFRPPSLNDYQDQLMVIAGDAVIRVPITAQRERCQIGWPKSVECGHCWVGDRIRKEVVLKNKGGDSQFSLVGAEEGSEHYKIGYFKVSPTSLRFDRNTQLRLQIEFLPEEKGSFKQKIRYKTNEGDQQQVQIILEGGAYSAQIVLEELNGQKMLQQRVNNDLFIDGTELGKESQARLKIRNLAVVQVDYFWHYKAANITVDKKQGKMKPSELLEFSITIKPQEIVPENIKLELYLYNLPQKSLTGNVVSRNIDGKEAIQCLSVDVATKPVQSQLEVHPLYRRIAQPLYQNLGVNECVTITNNSSVARTFKINKICQDQGLEADCAQAQGIIEPHSQKQIHISFNLVSLTSSDKRAHFLLTFDNGKSQIFSLEGRSTYPKVHFDEQLLYYGLLKTFTLNKKKIVLRNPQKTPAEVSIVNKHRFYELQFYDFYQFEDESCYKRRFNIYDPVTSREIVEPFNIPPESEAVLDCYLNVMGQESIEEEVLFQIKNGETVAVKILGEVQDVEMSMNRASINMRQIYKGNVYNSNKFLARQLQLVNDGNHDCGFEIVPPEYEQCDIKIQPLKGIVKKNSVQRIDLLLEPIKTGDFQFDIKWRYFDDFKLHPDTYIEKNDQVWFNKEDGLKSMSKEKSLLISGKIRGMAMNYYLKDEARAKKVKVKVDDGLQSVKLSNSSFQASTLRGSQKLHENQKLVYPTLQELNFYNCEVNQVRQVEILIQNDSGLSTEYEVYAENYHTLEKPQQSSRKSTKGLIKVEQQPFSSEMGRTFIRNRALDRSQKIHLGNNKGISIFCEPACGILHKKQVQKVIITMFNDTSGRFKDNLLICVKNHETKKIPIDMHIKGTPVALSRNQLGIDFNQQIPFMHLGTILHSNGLVKKSIKVVNNGPKEVALKWLVYPYNKVDKSKDIFKIEIEQAAPGSGNLVELKWNALKPQVDKSSFFSIEPRQKNLKGREEFSFTVLIQQIREVGEFANLCICEPTLLDNGKTTRMDELAVVVKTETIQPALTMDVEHKNHINMLERFATAHEQFQTNSNNYVRVLKLKNNLNANLTFDLSVTNKEPEHQCFRLIQTKTNSPATTFSATSKNIQTSFVITSGSILQAKVELTANPSQLNHWPLQEKVRREGQVLLSYSNGQQQTINLTGWLYRPWVQLQMPNHQLHSSQNFQIDFGTVHIKNSKKQAIYLINPSRVDGKWSISYIKYHQSIKYKFEQALWTKLDYEDQSIHDEKKCWRLSVDGGVVKNRSIPVHYMPNTLALPGQDDHYAETHKPVQIQIMFKPEANVLYKSKFRIAVVEGLTFDIVLKGRGTYQEQLEKK